MKKFESTVLALSAAASVFLAPDVMAEPSALIGNIQRNIHSQVAMATQGNDDLMALVKAKEGPRASQLAAVSSNTSEKGRSFPAYLNPQTFVDLYDRQQSGQIRILLDRLYSEFQNPQVQQQIGEIFSVLWEKMEINVKDDPIQRTWLLAQRRILDGRTGEASLAAGKLWLLQLAFPQRNA